MAFRVNTPPSVAQRFSQGFEESLDSRLQAMAERKAKDIESRDMQRLYTDNGIEPQVARLLASDPNLRKSYFERLRPEDLQATAPEPQQDNEDPSMQQMLNMVQPQQQSQEIPQAKILGGKDQLMRAIQEFQQGQLADQRAPQQQQQQIAPQAQSMAPRLQQQPGQPQQTPAKRAGLGDVLSRPSPGQEAIERRHAETLSHSEKLSNRKSNKDYIQKAYDAEKSKKEEDRILKRVISIREGGNARVGALSQLMNKLGINFEGLKGGDTLELEKLGKWFLRGGPAMFGGKVSNSEMLTLLSQVPNEMQTDKGAERIANQMLLANEYSHAETKAIKDVIKENGGEPPWDLQIKVQDRMEPIDEELSRRFINAEPVFTTKSNEPVEVDKLTSQSASEYKSAQGENGEWYKSVNGKWVRDHERDKKEKGVSS